MNTPKEENGTCLVKRPDISLEILGESDYARSPDWWQQG
jgi:hypothetical protein